ncbi:hypothetical protein V8F20_009648 [Naviculisporaceae sp. PSN 640]
MPLEREKDSNAETTDTPPEDSAEATTGIVQTRAEIGASSRKRKSLDGSAEPDEVAWPQGNQKKVKLDSGLTADGAEQQVLPQVKDSSQGRDKSLLPPEIWHYIFTFCPPKSLANLLSVNKLFNRYLDPSSSVVSASPVSVAQGVLGPLKPNAIWQASRRLFWPHMPVPLRSKTELEMWRLACSPVCQGCRKTDSRGPPNPAEPPRDGPGPDGVAVVWPFASCLCLSCLFKTSIKEVDLQLMPTVPSAIVPALPFVMLSRDLVIVPGSTPDSGQPRADVQVIKLYSSADVDALVNELMTVKEMGAGTVDEWLKGLAGRGNELRHEASKWEKWEISGGVAKMRRQLYPGYEPPSKTPAQNPDLPANAPPASLSSRSMASTIARHPSLPSRPDSWASEIKASRKAEIERRAMQLDPPLTPAVLRHIPAFQAAMQIVATLDDKAWDVLWPRLLSQREEAERMEKETTKHAATSTSLAAGRQLEATLATTKEARDLVDKEWEEIQAPLRAKISGYADDIIRDKWDKGRKVSKDSCSKFATEVLIHVRKRFYDEVAKEAVAARAAGRSPVQDPPGRPFTQKLTLENMKWVFDTKIKPHTEPYRKEIFYCNGCEGNFKSFGFEGVVQHYAAKHTNALSVGSIVVHWRAEWPEHPPFASEGRPAKSQFYNLGPGPAPFPHGTPLPPPPYHYQPPPPLPPAPISYPPQSGPGYAAAPYTEHYSQPPPPPPYPVQPPYGAPLVPPGGYTSQQPYAPPPNPYSPYPPPPGPYAHPPAGADSGSGYAPAAGANYPYNYGPHATNGQPQPAYPGPPPAQYQAPYQTKLDDVARNSREVWNALANVSNLPGSARVFATIHHLAKRYRARYHETPPLTMFIDGLSNNKDMRPVRNINGLVCKACHFGLGNAASVEQERRSFSLPQLANHFQSKHIDPMAQHMSPPLDWIADMVLLPDLQSISDILPAASENQRNLLSDAFPEALRPRGPAVTTKPPYQHQDHHPGAHGGASGGVQAMSNGPSARVEATTGHVNNANGYHHQFNQPTNEGYGSEAYYNVPPLGRSSGASAEHGYFSGRPASDLEANRVAQFGGGRRSPQRPQRSRHESSAPSYKKKGGKNKRGKPLDRDESNRREHEAQMQEHEARQEENEIKAMWAADRAGATRTYSSANPGLEEPRSNGYAIAAKQPSPRASPPRDSTAHPEATRPEHDVSNIIAALEQHLNEGHPSSATQTEKPVQSDKAYSYSGGGTGLPVEVRSSSRAYERHGEQRTRSRSPPAYDARHYRATPALPVREQNLPTRQAEAGYYPRPSHPADHGEAGYERYRVRSDYPEQHAQHPDDRRYGLPVQRLDRNTREQTMQPEHPRYSEPGPAPPRGPVELYEIVHVIDESGEYYIKRPVRREVEPPRMVYESHQKAYRDVDPYAAYEPVSGPPVSRPSRFESRRPDLRADPTYEDEYDPRYPRI